jgi:hypothetical protein
MTFLPTAVGAMLSRPSEMSAVPAGVWAAKA